MDILKYKDYEGTAELDMSRGVCRGKILFINDLVTYEATQPSELQKEFEAAVEDYFETCVTLGREPQKSLKGQFNVRIAPAIHKAATLKALTDGTSLNDVVTKALDAYLNARIDVNHIETKNYYVGVSEYKHVVAFSGEPHKQEFFVGSNLNSPFSVVAASTLPSANTVKGGKHVAARH